MENGVLTGIVCAAGVAIAVYIWRKLRKSEISDNDLNNLFDEVSNIEDLNGKELSQWFKKKLDIVPNSDNLKSILSYLNKDALVAYHITVKQDVKSDKVLLQFIYDENKSEVIDNRLIRFNNIDTNLQMLLEENDGLVIFSK